MGPKDKDTVVFNNDTKFLRKRDLVFPEQQYCVTSVAYLALPLKAAFTLSSIASAVIVSK